MTDLNGIARKDKRYVVLGFPRSGTTLLGRLLSSHPNISCPTETNLLNACGRFLSEEVRTEGPPIGVLSGLEFLNIDPEFVYTQLRSLFFSVHDKAANGKEVTVEKSGFDVFYIDEIEKMLAGHCRFISIVRNPFDVVASVKDLVDTVGLYLPELHEYIQKIPDPYEAFAAAWTDCNTRLLQLEEDNKDDFHRVKYEDLINNTGHEMNALSQFMGVDSFSDNTLQNALAADSSIGLGDWRIYESNQIQKDRVDRWKGKIGKSSANRVCSRVEEVALALQYTLPRLPKTPGRDKTVKQYSMAKKMLQSMNDQSK